MTTTDEPTTGEADPPRFTDAMIAELIAESKRARVEAEAYNRFFFRFACVAMIIAMVACVLCVILNFAV